MDKTTTATLSEVPVQKESSETGSIVTVGGPRKARTTETEMKQVLCYCTSLNKTGTHAPQCCRLRAAAVWYSGSFLTNLRKKSGLSHSVYYCVAVVALYSRDERKNYDVVIDNRTRACRIKTGRNKFCAALGAAMYDEIHKSSYG